MAVVGSMIVLDSVVVLKFSSGEAGQEIVCLMAFLCYGILLLCGRAGMTISSGVSSCMRMLPKDKSLLWIDLVAAA
jgi:hypothetical protein